MKNLLLLIVLSTLGFQLSPLRAAQGIKDPIFAGSATGTIDFSGATVTGLPGGTPPFSAITGAPTDNAALATALGTFAAKGANADITRLSAITSIATDMSDAARVPFSFSAAYPYNKTYDGPARSMEWWYTGVAAPFDLSSYFTERGAFYTSAEVVFSQKRSSINGHIQGVSALSDGSEQSWLKISPDINGPDIAAEMYGSMAGSGALGHNNQALLAGYDLDAIHGGSGAYSPGYGTKRFSLGIFEMLWGDNLSTDPKTNATTKLSWNGVGVDGLTVEPTFTIKDGTAPIFNLTKTGTLAGTAQIYNDGGLNIISSTGIDAIYYRASDGHAFKSRNAGTTFATIDSTGLAVNGAISGSNFSGTSSGTNTGDQNLFSTIAVSGQSNVVADTTGDTLTLAAGSGITITTNASTDTITIAASGGSGPTAGTGLLDTSGTWSVAAAQTTITSIIPSASNQNLTLGGNGTGIVAIDVPYVHGPLYIFDSLANAQAKTYAGSKMGFDTNLKGLYLSSDMGVNWASGTDLSAFTRTLALNLSDANTLEINNGTPGTYRDLKLRNLTPTGGNGLAVFTVATLPATAATGLFQGSCVMVTDSNTSTFNATVAGGGSTIIGARYDGTNWKVF